MTEASNINSIVKSVEISKKILLSTYSYNFLFYRVNAINIEIDKSDMIVENVNFPFNEEGLKNNETVRLKIKDQSFYNL